MIDNNYLSRQKCFKPKIRVFLISGLFRLETNNWEFSILIIHRIHDKYRWVHLLVPIRLFRLKSEEKTTSIFHGHRMHRFDPTNKRLSNEARFSEKNPNYRFL